MGYILTLEGAPPMLVYMLLNIIEERAYVGQTTTTPNDRLHLHFEQVKEGSQAPVHEALRKWPEKEWWIMVVLQNCYDQEELDRAEESWIKYCHSADSAVGYNIRRTVSTPVQRPMSEERREFFRECGRRGAAKSKANAAKRQLPHDHDVKKTTSPSIRVSSSVVTSASG